MADTTTPAPGAPSPFPTLPNWRDLGYWPTADGRIVKPGQLYRTTEFERTSAADLKAVGDLGLATIIDLRTAEERATCPDPVYPDVGPLWLDILADAPHTGGADPARYVSDPSTTSQLTPGLVHELFIATYTELINSGSALKYYREFYQLLLADDLTPTAFHCTTGKDRTGWTAASFLTLMGVSKGDVYTDYLLTNSRLVPALQPVIDKLVEAGGDEAALKAIMGVDEKYLDHAFGLVEKGWGSMDAYFAEALGIDSAAAEELRARYLIDPA